MLPKNDVETAQREAAKDRAHEMCISKIKSLDAEYRAMAAANKKLAAENGRLKGEVKNFLDSLAIWNPQSDKNKLKNKL